MQPSSKEKSCCLLLWHWHQARPWTLMLHNSSRRQFGHLVQIPPGTSMEFWGWYQWGLDCQFSEMIVAHSSSWHWFHFKCKHCNSSSWLTSLIGSTVLVEIQERPVSRLESFQILGLPVDFTHWAPPSRFPCLKGGMACPEQHLRCRTLAQGMNSVLINPPIFFSPTLQVLCGDIAAWHVSHMVSKANENLMSTEYNNSHRCPWN